MREPDDPRIDLYDDREEDPELSGSDGYDCNCDHDEGDDE